MRANFTNIFCTAFALLLLCSCSGSDLPEWLTGEPSEAELKSYNGPASMPRISSDDAAYPNLADVPSRPNPTLTPDERERQIEKLKEENKQGVKEVLQFERTKKRIP